MTGLPLLETNALSLRIAGRSLLDGLNVQIAAGERWCLLGPNGAGKTSLFEALAGLARLSGGRIKYAGQALERLAPRAAARHRAYLPQHWRDAFDASVYEVVSAGRHPHLGSDGWETPADHARVEAALATMGLAGFAPRRVFSLSGGERQRVALATALAQDAPLLLLDEPLNHLDLRQQQFVLHALQALTACGTTGLLCSVHDLNVAERFATHGLLIDGQGGAWSGPVAEVFTAERLGAAFGVALECLERGGQRWWFAPSVA